MIYSVLKLEVIFIFLVGIWSQVYNWVLAQGSYQTIDYKKFFIYINHLTDLRYSKSSSIVYCLTWSKPFFYPLRWINYSDSSFLFKFNKFITELKHKIHIRLLAMNVFFPFVSIICSPEYQPLLFNVIKACVLNP